jgi:Protein of unknown function (DUF2946)
MNARKTIRILAVSFAVLALLVFSTTVVSDWDCHNAADDAHCPYCHLTHQAPAPEPLAARTIFTPRLIASLPLPEDAGPIAAPVFTQTSPRAPPTA